MFGNNPRVNPPESRKRLLVAESELNRAQWLQEWRAMAEGVRSLAQRVRSISSLVSAAALLVAGVSAFRRSKATPARVKLSWLQASFKYAGLISTLWLAFRSRRHDQKDK